ncbi:HAMP domain-containing protein [Labilibaculum sp. A4]|uniref:sensor histidine kinase n=1 Tax=Labilibaculum euxinus TaxID=2686357 RepID=UPI000F624ECB|nr:sensor histidine kinase [Labilibaculum euxinus]MDQ1771915.1 histidine kinase [Labilibaculum euxinus]MWN77820.1 HAMP domain-containing protein [Labilibaculum euxinus]
MRKSLANKLLIYFVVLNLLSILIVGIFAYTQAKDALILRTFNQLTSVRIEKKKRVEDFFQQCIHEIEAISTLTFSFPPEKSTVNLSHFISDHRIFKTGFASLLTGKQNYKSIYLYQSNTVSSGFQIKPKTGDLSQTKLQPEHFQLFAGLLPKNEISVRELLNPKDQSKTEILICKTISFQDQKVVLAFGINTEIINSIMLDRNPLNGLGKSGEAYLVGEDHLLRSTSRFQENSIYAVKSSTKGVKLAFQDSIGSDIFKDYRGVQVLSSYSKMNLPDLNWVILAEIDQHEAMIPIRNYGNSMFYILIILSLLLLGVVAIIANTITAPIRKLRAETEKISSGIYEQVTDIKADGEIMELVAAFNQMTQKIKEQQENLQIAKDQSISSMIDGQEAERSRLARELHDGLAQTILAIKMRLENTAPENAAAVLGESREMFSDLMTEIRGMSNDLMPAVLREFGLNHALGSLLQRIEENSLLQTDLQIQGDLPEISKKTETYLYRIAQEATNNIIKHGQAKNINIQLTQKADSLFFEIKDDGIGLPLNGIPKNGNGLSNIKERISILGGNVFLEEEYPHGLKVQCKIPLVKISV